MGLAIGPTLEKSNALDEILPMRCRCDCCGGLGGAHYADSIPPGWESNNLEPVGYSALDNRKGAFKMAIKKVNGHWYLYMGHLWHGR
jgi:hypothetical protein